MEYLAEVKKKSWMDIRNSIHAKILDSTFSPGDKLPKDEELAIEYSCARTTIQRAMRDLSDSGIVVRRRKGGTRVRQDPVTRATLDIPITRKEVEQKNCIYGYQLIEKSTQEIPLKVAANFDFSGPVEMLRIKSLHLSNQSPYIYEDRWVSTITVPEILNVNLEIESANEWLVRNRPYSRCDLRLYAIKAPEDIAKIFEIEIGEALFVIERTTWIDSQPITSVKAITRPGYQLLTRS